METKTIKETKTWVIEPKETEEGKSLRVALVVHTNGGGYVEEEFIYEFDGINMTIWNTQNEFMNVSSYPLLQLKNFLRELLEEK